MDEGNNAIDLFDEIWTYVDEHYIYFEMKEVDWDDLYSTYRSRVTESTKAEELYEVCHAMLLELRDGHNFLRSEELNYPAYNFRQGYEVHFSAQTVQDSYINGDLVREGNLYYGVLEAEIGYIYIHRMSKYGSLPTIIKSFKEQGLKGLVIDIRNNGGGDSNPVIDMLGEFVKEPTTLGYYIEKSGPAHDDVTPPLEVKAIPSSSFYFDLPVTVITNRGSFSAASYLASMFGEVPGVTLVGQRTGGGGGGNLGYQLSNQWFIAVSASDFINTSQESIEPGVTPDILVENTEERLAQGIDDMLEKAIEVILK